MLVLRDPAALRRWRCSLPPGVRLGFVPTMGNLHEGHIALVRAAQQVSDTVVVSIFVNPLQFNDAADLARYPRTEAADLVALNTAGVDAVFLPSVEQLLPPAGAAVRIDPGALAAPWEGALRPGHFAGMATIVAKLLNVVAPGVAVFGQKDFQQLAIVRAMVQSLDFPVELIGCPTERADDGLALSSRNRFLTEQERAVAPLLYRQLNAAAAALSAGQPTESVIAQAQAALSAAGFVVDYFALCDQSTLAPTTSLDHSVLLTAARLGAVRLLDNLLL